MLTFYYKIILVKAASYYVDSFIGYFLIVFFSWKLFHESDREVYLILFRRTNSAYVQKGNSNCGLKISNNPDVWRILH